MDAQGVALLDFDDLLLHTAAAIEDDAAVAEEFRNRYRCFVVDEYQDVTPLQQRVLSAWLGDRDDLTVVGDANQTIYSFTGASPRYLLDFSRRFPDATVVRLERDYRSTPQVVSLANRVIAAARGRVAGSKLHLVGQRDPGPEPTFGEHLDEVAEAAAVAASISRLVEAGTPPSEIAVLYRINAQSEVYEEALTEAGIAYQVRGGEGFFSRQEIRQALLALQRAANRGTDGDAALPDVVRGLLEPLGLTAEPPTGTRARERWEALVALAELVDEEVAHRPQLELPDLLAELRTRADSRHPPVVQGVTLASLHAAKGLEWDAVFLVGLTDGTLPISHALSHGAESEAVEEERRLLYVGITRARMHLALSWSLSRNPGGRQSRKSSRFLNGLSPQTQADPAPSRSRRNRGAASRCRICNNQLTTPAAIMLRRCETCAADIDDELLLQLKDWRLRTAKEMNVPAYVVFTDNTLIAIAELLPTDDAALVAIPGIGARKLEQFGPDVLDLVRSRVKTAQRSRPKTAGQKIACAVELLRFNLESQFPRSAAASRRAEGATMIIMNVFGVCQVGDAGSRHAAHAARRLGGVAQAHRRRDRRVRGLGLYPGNQPTIRHMATDPKSPGSVATVFSSTARHWSGSPQYRRPTRKQVNRTCRNRQSPTSSHRSCLVMSAIPTCGSLTARPIWNAPRRCAPTARFDGCAWPRRWNARNRGECGAVRFSIGAAS